MKFIEYKSLENLLSDCKDQYNGEVIEFLAYFKDESNLYPIFYFCPNKTRVKVFHRTGVPCIVKEANSVEDAWQDVKSLKTVANKRNQILFDLKFA